MSTVQTICESGMYFICDPCDTFFVEKYAQDAGLRSVMVEAKTSAPHPEGISKAKFKEFIGEVAQKAIDGFSLLFSVITSRRKVELGEFLASIDYAKANFCLVLVIKNHEKEWLPNVQDALREYLRHFYTAWNWGSLPVLVLNEEMAARCGLILAPVNESE